ncbi:sialate O-acetylesterase-like isoform X2 [Littorina saxatilis]|uniref:sialate O-acetylesterase-like isoform X2 n=1 Tax=Littorina saxatilis TaxID=31220 RepID=UPI0038B510BD
MKIVFALFACFACSSTAQNVVRMQEEESGEGSRSEGRTGFAFATYYNSHMVLQQAPQQAVVWGIHPDVGDRIIVKVAELQHSYSADVRQGPDTGVWSVTLDPIAAGGPYTITAYADDGSTISITDVLFGDVWVCSGQSNMQFSTDQIYNASQELNASSQYTDIRLFTVAMRTSTTPLYDLSAIAEPWSLPNATTVGKSPFNYFSAVCWLFGKGLYKELGYPIGLIDTTWGGTPVEAWSSPVALARCGLEDTVTDSAVSYRTSPREDGTTDVDGPGSNSQLWNAMVYPLLNMTVYGAIWYQGEADASEPKMHHYNCTFPAMIDDWRTNFAAASQQTKPDFPFGFVQLSGNSPDPTVVVGFPDIRWHQTADFGYTPNPRMTNVFMAVSMDLPDFNSPYGSVHPRDKQDVAERLLLSGLRVAYNKGSEPTQGPRPVSVVQQGDTVAVTYSASNSGDNIRVKSRNGFEFCCSWNGKAECTPKNSWWLPAPIISTDPTTLSLDGSVCGADQFIVGLRYAWHESPCVFKHCAVYSTSNDLPAPPFITIKPQSSGTAFTYTIDWSKPQLIP